MCHNSCIAFGHKFLTQELVKDKAVIEVGSANHNGTLRQYLENLNPKSYLGIDILQAPGVDQICCAEDLVARFGSDKFDLLISTEVMEHVKDWKEVIRNFKEAVCPGGKILITTRSKGFAYHSCPYDFWRYEISDMKNIFSDFIIDVLVSDPEEPGVFILATKPQRYVKNNLSSYALYSIVKRRRMVDSAHINPTIFDIKFNNFLTKMRTNIGTLLPSFLKLKIKKLLFKPS